MATTKRAARPRKTEDVAYDRKRLAVFCDGTWNDLRMKNLTNVARLAKCVEPRGWDGRRQVVFYDSGVGVASGVSGLSDWLVTKLGGAIGAGLDDKIESAYRFLVLNYQPGDEIFVFGFSRGAYTARSLCGLIRKCGIVRRDCFERITDAMTLYRDPSKKYDDPLLKAFRAEHTYQVPGAQPPRPIATGSADKTSGGWQNRAVDFQKPDAKPLVSPPSAPSGARETDKEFVWLPPDPPPVDIYRLMYLGLWDTVGSMGVPNTIPFLSRLVNWRYKFHNTNASDLLFSIRHACALDEDRKSFDITPVQNIHKLNQDWSAAHGKQVDDPSNAETYVAYTDRPYQQRWFPGTHGSIGGGNPERGISSGALVWIAVGALRAGLKLNWDETSELGEAKTRRNPLAPYRVKADPKDPKKAIPLPPWAFDGIGLVTGYADRVGHIPNTKIPKNPQSKEDLNSMALTRREKDPKYRPATLKDVYPGEAHPIPLYRVVAAVLKWAAVVAFWLLVAYLLWCWLAR